MTPEGWAAYLHWRPEFAKAIDEALYPLSWLDSQVARGEARFAYTDTAAILYEYKHYPSGAFQVEGLVAAGDVEAIVEFLIPFVEAEAAHAGAVAAQIASRPAWARVLRERGYVPYQAAIRKVLAPRPEVSYWSDSPTV